MIDDARFEDGASEDPIRLRALDADDLKVIRALVQDAVFPVTDMTWDRTRRRFAVLLNRFRWEQGGRRTPPERVRSLLVFEDVSAVRSQGIDREDRDLVLSLLTIDWIPGEDGTGRVTLVLAGDGGVALEVEALEVTLSDVTRPYTAPSGKTPEHPD